MEVTILNCLQYCRHLNKPTLVVYQLTNRFEREEYQLHLTLGVHSKATGGTAVKFGVLGVSQRHVTERETKRRWNSTSSAEH